MTMRTMEPSTKGPDDDSRDGGGPEFFLLLGTSELESAGRALLEASGVWVGVGIFLPGVAILASSAPRKRPPHSDPQPRRLRAPLPRELADARARARLRSSDPAASARLPSPLERNEDPGA